MEPIEVDVLESTDLADPVIIEGLPGVGLVGKLAVDHLIAELDATAVRRIHSEYFPPAVSVDEDGEATLPDQTVYAVETDGRDMLLLGGEAQAQEPPWQYRLAERILDIAESFDVSDVVTLGGYGTGEDVDEYHVVGASAGGGSLKAQLADAGATFERDDGPGSIVGMSGLLLGLGARRGLNAAGLLGITPGYHVDPASARAVLDVLSSAFDVEVSVETLDDQAEQVQRLIEQLQQLQGQPSEPEPPTPGGEELRYFG